MPVRQIPLDRLRGLQDQASGLGESDAARRRARFGYNDIVVKPPSTWKTLVRETARDPMIWFLVGVGALFAVLGDYAEAAVLAVAIIPLAAMDAWLHRRTQASTRGLASRLAAQATVLRGGARVTLPAREVVPGDLVEVPAGEPFPADGLVVSGTDLQAEESSLTGEAYPVRKRPLQILRRPGGGEAENWVFAGTRLLTGQALVRIAYTGPETLYGEIVRSAQTGVKARSPLQIMVARMVAVTLAAALAMCAVLAAVRLVQGHGIVDALLSAVTLAVAALPEEFPVAFTFFLGVGVYRLARRQALVRRAVAVENIGRITCICSDKTGTLTEGRLVLAHIIPVQDVPPERFVREAALAAREESGDPLDAALLAAAPAAPAGEILAAFPFTEERRRETAIARLGDGSVLAVVKGAPETVFALCTGQAEALEAARAEVAACAADGHKVIAVAARPLDAGRRLADEPAEGFSFRGLLAFEDPLREGVLEAVRKCRRAGIRVIMVTGDHPATAEAIAREAGLGSGRPVVARADALPSGDDDGLVERLRGIDVVARAAPADKAVLVRALRRAGEIVAVTGDGVNDVPALQEADVGIAMGERGTQSAREVAAVVLLDDNFRTIVRAIAEGRQLFRNLQLAFAYLLLIHIALVVSAAAVPLANNPLLYLPVHVVWLELIIHPTSMLVFQEMPTSARLLPTQRNNRPRFFTGPAWAVIVLGGLLLAGVLFFGFEYALGADGDAEHARSLAVGALVAASAAMTAILSGLRTVMAAIVAAASLASVLLLVQVPGAARLLHMTPLHWQDWGYIAATAALAGLIALLVTRSLSGDAGNAA